MKSARVLIIGFGNPGRRDDGLGPALAAEMERLALPGVQVESCYQLNVEDAAAIAACNVVVFADAAVAGTDRFYLHRLAPAREIGFCTHSVSPAAVLGLARELFAAPTEGFVLGIRGYEFDNFGEGLSAAARDNLSAAAAYLEIALMSDDIAAHATGCPGSGSAAASATCEVEPCGTASTSSST